MRALSPAVPKPAHVPDAAVCDFDMFFDPQLLGDPHERVRDLLRRAPNGLFWTPRNGGHWTAIGHQAVFTASRDPDTFSSSPLSPEDLAKRRAAFQQGGRYVPQQKPITLDPPDHGKF